MPDKKTSKKPSVVSTKSSPTGMSKSLQSFLNRSYGESRAYVVEYGLLLVLTGALLGLLSNMLYMIFEYAGQSSRNIEGLGFDYYFSVVQLSAVLLILPIVAILFRRTSESERKKPLIKNNAWRRGLLGVFIALLSSAALLMAIGLLSSIITAATLKDIGFSPRANLASLITVIIFVLVAWIYGQDYRSGISTRYVVWQQYFRYGLIFGGAIILLLFAFIPMAQQKDSQLMEKQRGGMYNDLNGYSECVDGGQDKPYNDRNYREDAPDQPVNNY